jgi:hypothetical protein
MESSEPVEQTCLPFESRNFSRKSCDEYKVIVGKYLKDHDLNASIDYALKSLQYKPEFTRKLPEEIREMIARSVLYDANKVIKLRNAEVRVRAGVPHSIHGPAVIYRDRNFVIFEWYKNGILHRDDDGPSIESSNGDKEWYINGIMYRRGNKPSRILASGEKIWTDKRGNMVKISLPRKKR